MANEKPSGIDLLKVIESIITAFCQENSIEVTLSQEMPAGYETAYGTYDVTVNTLFLNTALLQNACDYEVLFYLFHELRHAVQYLRPELFDMQIQESRFYVVLFNGCCFKLVGDHWQECQLEGTEAFFTGAYLSLPYELDANRFAWERTKQRCGDLPALQALYSAWLPEETWPYAQLQQLFRQIDAVLSSNG